jgi:hypothetical protein
MSTPRLQRWEELACDAALVGLDERERAELEALVVDDSELVALERAAGEVTAAAFDAMSDGDTTSEMPPGLTERIIRELSDKPAENVVELASHRKIAAPRLAPGAERAPRVWLPWTLVAAAVVLAVIGWSRSPSSPDVAKQPAPRTTLEPVATVDAGRRLEAERTELLARSGTSNLPWKATADDAARTASGDVVWHGGLQRGFMHFHGLAPNDAKKEQYQLWIFDEERDEAFPVDGGVFDVGAEGDVIVAIAPKLRVAKPKLFAVTVEKPGGVVVSKRERIVLTASPQS